MAVHEREPSYEWGFCELAIVPSHKSHNASNKYPTMHHFVTEMCTFLLQNGALSVGHWNGALWDLCNRSIYHPPTLHEINTASIIYLVYIESANGLVLPGTCPSPASVLTYLPFNAEPTNLKCYFCGNVLHVKFWNMFLNIEFWNDRTVSSGQVI